MRVLRVALGAIVGLVAIWVATELWKLLVSWELAQGIRLPHGLNELISFLPAGIANGYVLWRIHRRSFTLDLVASVVVVDVTYCLIALLSDPSGGLLMQIWAVPGLHDGSACGGRASFPTAGDSAPLTATRSELDSLVQLGPQHRRIRV